MRAGYYWIVLVNLVRCCFVGFSCSFSLGDWCRMVTHSCSKHSWSVFLVTWIKLSIFFHLGCSGALLHFTGTSKPSSTPRGWELLMWYSPFSVLCAPSESKSGTQQHWQPSCADIAIASNSFKTSCWSPVVLLDISRTFFWGETGLEANCVKAWV